MFTGIVTAIGTIAAVEDRGDLRVTIGCPWDPAEIDIGASIACSGVCLTVVERAEASGGGRFAVDVSNETVSRTVPGKWNLGQRLNLEPALKLGDEMGGHLVTGHVDTAGEIRSNRTEGGSTRLEIRAGKEFAPFIAPKGSITVDGVSLTVNEVRDQPGGACDFTLNIIPHTAQVTTLGALAVGDGVNLEIDVLARYLKRMESLRN